MFALNLPVKAFARGSPEPALVLVKHVQILVTICLTTVRDVTIVIFILSPASVAPRLLGPVWVPTVVMISQAMVWISR